MIKFFLKFILALIIFGLFLFGPNFALALNAPSGLVVTCGSRTMDDCVLTPSFDWNDVPGAAWYVVRTYTSMSGINCSSITEGSWNRLTFEPTESKYPTSGSPALAFNPLSYCCWQVRAENANEQSSWTLGLRFRMQDIIPLPGPSGGGSPIGLTNPLQAQTLQEAIDALINFLFYLAMAVAPILIIYAGFLILTAGGDATKIKKARQIILWTLIAVAIILFAKGFPALIKGALGG